MDYHKWKPWVDTILNSLLEKSEMLVFFFLTPHQDKKDL